MEQPIQVQGRAAQQPSAPGADSRALVIDLEHALLRCNLLQEALFSDPVRSFAYLRTAITGGRDAFFEQVLTAQEIDYAHLPYEPDVLNLGLGARAQGRKIYIAATRFQDHAAAIASHLGFDGVVALADVCAGIQTDNTGAPVLAFDVGSYNYVGNGQAPESVWRAASTTYVVGGADQFLRRLELINPSVKKIGGDDISWGTWLTALRVHQYAKNTLVFVPALTSHQFNLSSLGSALLAFLAFSACASSAYLLNDLFDLAVDRQHPSATFRSHGRSLPYRFSG